MSLGLPVTTEALFELSFDHGKNGLDALLESMVLCKMLYIQEWNREQASMYGDVCESDGYIKFYDLYDQLVFPTSIEKLNELLGDLELLGYVSRISKDIWSVSKARVADKLNKLGYSFSVRDRISY